MKRILTLFLVVVMALSFTSCGSNDSSSSVLGNSSSDISSSSEVEKTSIVDRYGNEIEIPKTINKIVSTAPSNTEILVDLGLGDKIAVVDTYAGDLPGLSKDVQKMDFYNLDIEALVSVKADLVVASEINMRGEEDPYEQLKSQGTIVVYLPTAKTIDDIKKDITFLGDFTKTQDKAKEITDTMQTKIDSISEIAKTITEKKNVYFEIDIAPNIYTLGKGTYIDEAIKLVGANNVFGDSEGWVALSEEQVLTANPDVILTNVSYIESPIDEIKTRQGWDRINAVKDDKVFSIDTDASSRATHKFMKALDEIAKAIYPEFYK